MIFSQEKTEKTEVAFTPLADWDRRMKADAAPAAPAEEAKPAEPVAAQ